MRKAELKQGLLEWHFGRYRKAWDGECDDRAVMVGTYDSLMDALDEMKQISNSTIWSAFNKEYHNEERKMCEIIKRFTGQYPVCGTYSESEYYPE